MAAYFQLIDRTSGKAAVFQEVDNAICHNLEIPWDPKRYAYEWYGIIGYLLAIGRSFQEITDGFYRDMEKYPDDVEGYRMLIRINHFIQERYMSDAWRNR